MYCITVVSPKLHCTFYIGLYFVQLGTYMNVDNDRNRNVNIKISLPTISLSNEEKKIVCFLAGQRFCTI